MANKRIFRAADASAALVQVQNALGPDAYIIEINNVGNFVEIIASRDEPPLQKPNKPFKTRKSLQSAEQNLEPIFPEAAAKSVGSVAYTNELQLEPILDNVAFEKVENEGQQRLVFDNVFRDSKEPQKDLDKHLEKSTHWSATTNPAQTEPVTPSKFDRQSKPSSVADPRTDKLDTSNIRRMVSQKAQDNFVFGDLLNFGLSPAFIKKEFGLKEFDGSVARSIFTEKLVGALFDRDSASLFEDHGNLVFLGTPGSGKSTICAKLMHYFGTQYAAKPSVVHLTPEKLFEADRLRFHAKMFNFPFYRKYTQDNAALCQGTRQIVEIAWDNQISFANYFARNHNSYPFLKPFLVLPAETNYHTLKEVLRVCPMVHNVILNKCDFGRFSIRNLMMLYERGYKISSLSGDRSISKPLEMADSAMLHGFVGYTLDL